MTPIERFRRVLERIQEDIKAGCGIGLDLKTYIEVGPLLLALVEAVEKLECGMMTTDRDDRHSIRADRLEAVWDILAKLKGETDE